MLPFNLETAGTSEGAAPKGGSPTSTIPGQGHKQGPQLAALQALHAC